MKEQGIFILMLQFIKALKLYPVSWRYWLSPLPFAVGIVAYDEVRKYFVRRYPGGARHRRGRESPRVSS